MCYLLQRAKRIQLTVNVNHSMLKSETTPPHMLQTHNVRLTITTKKNGYTKPAQTQVHAGLECNWSLPFAVDAKDEWRNRYLQREMCLKCKPTYPQDPISGTPARHTQRSEPQYGFQKSKQTVSQNNSLNNQKPQK